jgi:inosose dehydratase
VCEAPGWGHELAPERVLSEMSSLGLRSTELGPTGYLGGSPEAVRAQLAEHGLRLVGGFLPVAMHAGDDLDLTEAEAAIRLLAEAGSDVVVFAAQSLDGSYDRKVHLTEQDWSRLLSTLRRLQDIAIAHDLLPTLHPHVGTAIEDRDSVLRLVEQSDVQLCLDTGHLLIGGMQPAELVERYAGRIAHVHLKDVRTSVAATVSAGDTSYLEAVRAGLYAPLGEGDLDIGGIVEALEGAGYQGWYVLEQDCALYGEPAAGAGPVLDASRSVRFLLDATNETTPA